MRDKTKTKYRTRKIQRKRWSTEETSLILEFVKRVTDNHLVTSSDYVENLDQLSVKLMSEVPVTNCTSTQVKNKIINMKAKYVNVCNWINKTGMSLIEERGYDAFRRLILQQCPFFDDLHEIFGSLGLVPVYYRNVFDDDDDDDDVNTPTQEEESISVRLSPLEPVVELEYEQDNESNPDLSDHSGIVTSREYNLLREKSFQQEITDNAHHPNSPFQITHSENESLQENVTQENERNPHSSDQSNTIAQRENEPPRAESSQLNVIQMELELKKLEYHQKKLEFEKEKWIEEKALRQIELDIQRRKLEEDARTARYELQMKMIADVWEKY